MTEREEREFNADVRRRQAEKARREATAAGGDVDGVWAELTRTRTCGFDPGEYFPLLLKAVEARARRSPEQFGGEMLARIVALSAYLVLRSHYLLAKRVEQYDRSPQGRGRVELPPAFTDRVIPQLLALQGSLAEILQTQASVARAWELARSKRSENDRAGAGPKAKAAPGGKAKARGRSGPARGGGKPGVNGKHSKNGTSVNRIAGLLGDLGLKPDGVHHDD